MIQPDFKGDLREVPVSVLAYIGDAVFELAVRLYLGRQSMGKAGELHRQSIKHVSAAAQAATADRILPQLTPEEQSIYRRARNSSPSSMPKNANLQDYLKATGFEAVVGYLYLKEDQPRLNELLAAILEEDQL